MSVHYKFKSALDFDTILFDGLHISVSDLKKAIVHQKRLGKAIDFDLQITNAQTKEEYSDNSTLIPKNTSLLIARIPLTHQQKKQHEAQAERLHQHKAVDKSNTETLDLSQMNGSEEDKINAMMAQSTADYDPKGYQKLRGQGQTGEVPLNYRCYKCHKPGHWIKNCPLNVNKDAEVKRNTGIPRSFLQDKDKDEQAAKEHSSFLVPEQKQEVPDDLICNICKDIFTDAVMIPCCGSSFCDECVRTALLESEDNECPDCKEKGSSPGSLIPNRFLRNSVNTFKNETGYSRPQRPVEKSNANEKPVSIPESQDPKTNERSPERSEEPPKPEEPSEEEATKPTPSNGKENEETCENEGIEVDGKKDTNQTDDIEERNKEAFSSHDEMESDFEDNIVVTVPPAYMQSQGPVHRDHREHKEHREHREHRDHREHRENREHRSSYSENHSSRPRHPEDPARSNIPVNYGHSNRDNPAQESHGMEMNHEVPEQESPHPHMSYYPPPANMQHQHRPPAPGLGPGPGYGPGPGMPMPHPSHNMPPNVMQPGVKPYNMEHNGGRPPSGYPPYYRPPYMPPAMQPRPGFMPMGPMRPRPTNPQNNLAAVYQHVQEKVGTGIIDDPLEAFNRIMKDREKQQNSRRHSPPPARHRSRSIERGFRGKGRPGPQSGRAFRRSPPIRDRSPPPRLRERSNERNKDRRRRMSSSGSDRSSRSRSSKQVYKRTKMSPQRRHSRSMSPPQFRNRSRSRSFSRGQYRERGPAPYSNYSPRRSVSPRYRHDEFRQNIKNRGNSPHASKSNHRRSRGRSPPPNQTKRQASPFRDHNAQRGMHPQQDHYARARYSAERKLPHAGMPESQFDMPDRHMMDDAPPGTETPIPGMEMPMGHLMEDHQRYAPNRNYFTHEADDFNSQYANKDNIHPPGRSFTPETQRRTPEFDNNQTRDRGHSPPAGHSTHRKERAKSRERGRSGSPNRHRRTNRSRSSVERHTKGPSERERAEKDKQHKKRSSSRDQSRKRPKEDDTLSDSKIREKDREREKDHAKPKSREEKNVGKESMTSVPVADTTIQAKVKKTKEKKKKKNKDKEDKEKKKLKKEKKDALKLKAKSEENIAEEKNRKPETNEETMQTKMKSEGVSSDQSLSGPVAESVSKPIQAADDFLNLYEINPRPSAERNFDLEDLALKSEDAAIGILSPRADDIKESPQGLKRTDSVLDIYDFEQTFDDLNTSVVNSTVDSDPLVPLPGASKWERDDDGFTVGPLHHKDEPNSNPEEFASTEDSEKSDRITTEVLKRAEHAIFARAINAIRPIEIKKISTERQKLYSGDKSPNFNQQPTTEELKAFQIVVPADSSAERSVEMTAADTRNREVVASAVSVKSRLGIKVESKRSRSISASRLESRATKVRSSSRPSGKDESRERGGTGSYASLTRNPQEISRNKSRDREYQRNRSRDRANVRNRSRERENPRPRSRERENPRPRSRERENPRPRSRERENPRPRSRERENPRPRSRENPRPRSRERENPRPRSRERENARPRSRENPRPRSRERENPRPMSRENPRPRSRERENRARDTDRRRDRSREKDTAISRPRNAIVDHGSNRDERQRDRERERGQRELSRERRQNRSRDRRGDGRDANVNGRSNDVGRRGEIFPTQRQPEVEQNDRNPFRTDKNRRLDEIRDDNHKESGRGQKRRSTSPAAFADKSHKRSRPDSSERRKPNDTDHQSAKRDDPKAKPSELKNLSSEKDQSQLAEKKAEKSTNPHAWKDSSDSSSSSSSESNFELDDSHSTKKKRKKSKKKKSKSDDESHAKSKKSKSKKKKEKKKKKSKK